MIDYLQYWEQNGLDYIIPPETNDPEGFDIGEVLNRCITGKVLEVGCGTGRIARYLSETRYFGIDINPAAVKKAKADNPNHKFDLYNLEKPLPKSITVLFYTVCLHIPDDLIVQQLTRATVSTQRVVIAEIMNPKYRETRTEDEYHINNHRSLEQYEAIMKDLGFVLRVAHKRPYKFYEGEEMTFAVFQRADQV